MNFKAFFFWFANRLSGIRSGVWRIGAVHSHLQQDMLDTAAKAPKLIQVFQFGNVNSKAKQTEHWEKISNNPLQTAPSL